MRLSTTQHVPLHVIAVVCILPLPPSAESARRSLHDALPISDTWLSWLRPPGRPSRCGTASWPCAANARGCCWRSPMPGRPGRSEEHTSELQSRFDLVCRLLLEKKKKKKHLSFTHIQE